MAGTAGETERSDLTAREIAQLAQEVAQAAATLAQALAGSKD